MVLLLAARPIASTADFRGFGPRPSLLINHLHCENRRTQGRIGQVGLALSNRRDSENPPRGEKVLTGDACPGPVPADDCPRAVVTGRRDARPHPSGIPALRRPAK
jgi:hypothetical protein